MKAYPVAVLCQVMDVSRSGFYSYLNRAVRPVDKELVAMCDDVKAIFASSDRTYGSRRMSHALRALGYPVGRFQARNLMRRLGLYVKPTKRFRVTTDSKHKQPVAPNKLARQFDVDQPNTHWAGDITYLWTESGWLYLAIVLDLYSRKVVGWSLNQHMTTDLVQDALKMAVGRRQPGPRLLHHTDRGSQYASGDYQQDLKTYGMVCSMSRKGNCWDNSVVERFFRSLKTERTNHQRLVQAGLHKPARQRSFQLCSLDRLRQIFIDTGLQDLLLVTLHGKGRQCDDRDVCR